MTATTTDRRAARTPRRADEAVHPRADRSGARRGQRAPEPRHAYATRGAAAVALAPQSPNVAPAPRPRPTERPNHLRVVAPSERARRRLTPAMAVLLTAAMFATLLAVAVAHTVLVEGQVRLDRLDSQLVEEQARYQELRTDVAELESPTRIVHTAQEMGMVSPADLQYLQPPAPDASTVGPTTGDDNEPVADPTVGADADVPWFDIKALLEAPAP
jgi:cell division protein FtsL